jgi:hypothetical protein
MIVLTKGMGHERHKLFLLKHLIKVTFLTMQQTKHLVEKGQRSIKMTKASSN